MGLMEERGPKEEGVVVCTGGEQFGGRGAEEGDVTGLCEFLGYGGVSGLVCLMW
jgi:hypothetical protein